jgi:putative transposase
MKVKLDKRFRRPGFDYGSNAFYFITINCNNRVKYLGSIQDEKFVPSPIGEIAINNWEEVPTHFPFVKLDEFQCMPDHFHALLQFKKPTHQIQKQKNSFGPQKDNLGVVIANFKASITRHANKNGIDFKWHSRYHDRIVDDLSTL